MNKLFTKDGFAFLLLGVSLGIGLGGTYGSQAEHVLAGMGIGLVIGVVGAIIVVTKLPELPPATVAGSTEKPKSAKR